MASGLEPQRDMQSPIHSPQPYHYTGPYLLNTSSPDSKSPIGDDSAPALASPPVDVTRAKTIANVPSQLDLAMTTLRSVLKDMKHSLDALPPVQSAIGGLEECLAFMQIREQTHQGYGDLMSDLTRLANLLHAEFVKSGPQSVPQSIANVARGIDEQTYAIKECQNQSRIDPLAAAKDNEGTVLECYRRIRRLFEHLHADVSSSIWDDIQEQRMDARLGKLMPAHEAYHNAALPTSMTKRVACTENTRVDLLNDIWAWTQQHDGPKIYWLNGLAGTGKTTIAYTLCKMLQEAKRLGGSFFCSRYSAHCDNVNKIVPTITYQLGRYSNPYRRMLYNALMDDPDVARRNIDTQFEHLVSQPLTKINKAIPHNVVMVIDALDECADVDGTKEVLDVLLRHADNLPIKFFVTSRPEPAISDLMTASYGAMRSILWLHDIDKSLVQADIKTFLVAALQGVQVTSSELNALADRAGCLFIFAATAVRYIVHRKGTVNHRQRLQAVLKLHPTQDSKYYTDIDKLYSAILANAFDKTIFEKDELEQRRRVLWTVACAREPLTTSALAELLNIRDVQVVEAAVQPLLSVLHVSELTSVVSTLHISFPDFLLDRERAQQFQCNEAGHSACLAGRCFQLMGRSLRFNICKLETSYMLDQDVPDLEDRVDKAISTALFYSCRYWGDHLSKGLPSPTLRSLLETFMQHHLLFWMEVLNLKKRISHGESALAHALTWVSMESNTLDLQDFIYDARNFLITFSSHSISLSTPHIYISALPLTSKKSRVWVEYWPRTQGLIRIESKAIEAEGKSTPIIWDVGQSFYSAAQSSDGKRIAFGSHHGLFSGGPEVNVWDTSSSTRIIGPLRAHRGRISALKFSPDDTRIASGSIDGTICIWDASDGRLITGPLHGHTHHINGLSFSPDGASLISSSCDHSIRLWDAYLGTPLGEPLMGHQGNMVSVAFSPDAKYLASGSDDYSIRVLNLSACTMNQQTFQGHSGAVFSIAYSSNALLLASGSEDCTVQVWDVTRGASLAGPFRGHSRTVSSVSFSPDSTLVVSGSYDKTVRVWEALSGTLLAEPFEAHGNLVNLVLFTADSKRILSGSYDGTIYVQDAIRVRDVRHQTTGANEPLGHTRVIRSVALSPDGTRVVSGSDDCMICVWSTSNGALVAGPFKGHARKVNSVAFSPDGVRIVSGSDDCTLRIWDASTGAMLGGPFKGHSEPVTSVTFSPDGNHVVSNSHDSSIRIWNSHTGQLVAQSSKRPTNLDPSVVHSPGRVVSVSSYTILDFHLSESSEAPAVQTGDSARFSPHRTPHVDDAGYIHCVAFSPDGMRVVAGTWDYTSLPLDARNGTVPHGPFSGHTHWVLSVALSLDAARVVSGSWDRSVRVWDAESGMMVAGPFEGHAHEVTSVGFSPDGMRVISGSADGTIRLWDLAVATHSDTTFHRIFSTKDGWLTNSKSMLLLWVPPDLRKEFRFPSLPNVAIINNKCSSFIDNSRLYLGDQWHHCYIPPVLFTV